jgi:hypothetical protein
VKELVDRALGAVVALAVVTVILVTTSRLLRPVLPFVFGLVLITAVTSYLFRGPHSRR